MVLCLKAWKSRKICFCNLINTPLLEYGSLQKIPLIISTGGATINDIDRAVKVINQTHNNLSILQYVRFIPVMQKILI